MEIEKNESLPEAKAQRYPFEQMEVGDSVLVADLPKAESIQNAAYAWGKKNGTGFKMTRRKVDNGYRVWRIV